LAAGEGDPFAGAGVELAGEGDFAAGRKTPPADEESFPASADAFAAGAGILFAREEIASSAKIRIFKYQLLVTNSRLAQCLWAFERFLPLLTTLMLKWSPIK
jgi:hypothetical protein